jgi:fumarate reductase subunit C
LVYTGVVSDILIRFGPAIAIGAVALVLLLGLVNMMRGGSPNRSQTLMRWRVILQFVAIIALMTALYVTQTAHSPGGG